MMVDFTGTDPHHDFWSINFEITAVVLLIKVVVVAKKLKMRVFDGQLSQKYKLLDQMSPLEYI